MRIKKGDYVEHVYGAFRVIRMSRDGSKCRCKSLLPAFRLPEDGRFRGKSRKWVRVIYRHMWIPAWQLSVIKHKGQQVQDVQDL